jgi:dTMP kinase
MRPLFIVLDGLDGTGKSTQCRLLADWLRSQGRQVVECVEPGSTAVGTELRAMLLGHRHDIALRAEALLFMAARAQVVEQVIRPALAAGAFVVSDRYLLANVVYQGHAGGLDVEDLRRVEEFATGGLEPDLTLVLDLSVESALSRRGREADRKELRDRNYHERVREGFLAEAKRRPGQIRVIEASPSIESVQAAIRSQVTCVMNGV